MFDFLTEAGTRSAAEGAIALFALVLARIAPIIELAPFLGGRAAPRTVKTAAALALSALVYPAVLHPSAVMAPPGGLVFASLLLKEALIGLTLGFVVALVFESVRMAGQIIDAARGQTLANALVPQLPERASVSADYLYQLSIALFFVIGGHRLFIVAIVRSYETIPPMGYGPFLLTSLDTTLLIARLSADAIALGVAFAMPVVAAILLADVVLALINKSAPQVNVFFLGMPLKALLGTGVLLLCLGLFAERFAETAVRGVANVEFLLDRGAANDAGGTHVR